MPRLKQDVDGRNKPGHDGLWARNVGVTSATITIYIDADACPVKQEVYRVAERHALKGVALKVFVVSNSPIAVPRDPMIERVVVGGGMDEADNWIAERAHAGDIVITADVPLASRCVKAGAEVIAPNGRAFSKDFDRDDAGDAQFDGFAAQRRRSHRRPEAVFAARPFQLSLGARCGHRAAHARGVWQDGQRQINGAKELSARRALSAKTRCAKRPDLSAQIESL